MGKNATENHTKTDPIQLWKPTLKRVQSLWVLFRINARKHPVKHFVTFLHKTS